jgi:hypothetical protein
VVWDTRSSVTHSHTDVKLYMSSSVPPIVSNCLRAASWARGAGKLSHRPCPFFHSEAPNNSTARSRFAVIALSTSSRRVSSNIRTIDRSSENCVATTSPRNAAVTSTCDVRRNVSSQTLLATEKPANTAEHIILTNQRKLDPGRCPKLCARRQDSG